MSKEITPEQEIWVMTGEGAEATGYNNQYIIKLAQKIWRLPEEERPIKLRKRRGQFYELWLPDLLRYKNEIGNGPQLDKK